MSLLVFTDLDASLLNEHDYDWRGAEETLKWLFDHQIPVILASSKTATEMRTIASEIGTDAPLICENGGSIAWPDGSATPVATSRTEILERLDEMRAAGYQFRSFRDLGVDGVRETTGLTPEQAAAALDRHATEPLLWDESPERLDEMIQRLGTCGLTVIKGGRFWHVAGKIDKANAMQDVVGWYASKTRAAIRVIAVGDSPNDAKMLSEADHGILMPDGSGNPKFELAGLPRNHHIRVADQPGSQGWGRAVRILIETLIESPNE